MKASVLGLTTSGASSMGQCPTPTHTQSKVFKEFSAEDLAHAVTWRRGYAQTNHTLSCAGVRRHKVVNADRTGECVHAKHLEEG